MKLRNFLPILMLLPILLLAAGCLSPASITPATITRLTPNEQPRNANNLYPVEVIFTSQQQTLRWDSLQAYVVANGDALPLRSVAMLTNRWEGFVPVPPTANEVKYRFKFTYLYNGFGQPKPNSEFSPNYTLKVLDQ